MVVAPDKWCQEAFGWGRISAAESCKDVTRGGKAPEPVCNSVVGVQNFSWDHRSVRFCWLVSPSHWRQSPTKKPHVWYEIYFFPGQSKYFDFLLLSLLTPQWHSSALWWCGGSAGGDPSAPAWLGLHHPTWQGVFDCALVTEARSGKENPTFWLSSSARQ